MPETLDILPESASKIDKYKALLPSIKSLLDHEDNLIANLANVSAALKQVFNFWWVGFYLVDKNKTELVLGPFQVRVFLVRVLIFRNFIITGSYSLYSHQKRKRFVI
jgi:GAF domain-containing protein